MHFTERSQKLFFFIDFSLICRLPNCLSDQFAVEKYKVEHILHNPEVPEIFNKYIFKYSAKRLKLKISGFSIHITSFLTIYFSLAKKCFIFNLSVEYKKAF